MIRRALSTLLALVISCVLIAGAFFGALWLVRMTPQQFFAKARMMVRQSPQLTTVIAKVAPGQVDGPAFGIMPQDGPAVEAATTTFWFEGDEYEVSVDVDPRVYAGAVSAVRHYDTRTHTKAEAQRIFVQTMVDDPAQKGALDALCAQMRVIKKKRDFSSDQYAEFLVKYVQCIPYDYDRASANLARINEKGDPRFPVQVLVDGKGDCDEKTYLLAALLKHEGYGCAALLFENEKHMSLGIQSASAGYKQTGFEFVETTGPSYIADPNQEYASGVTLESSPLVIPITQGKAYSAKAARQVAAIIQARESALEAAPLAKQRAESATTRGEFEAYKAQYEACYEARNTLRVTTDSSGPRIKEFKDRRIAYTWVKTYAWWRKM